MKTCVRLIGRSTTFSWMQVSLLLVTIHACSGASVTQTIQPQVELSLEAAPSGATDEAPTITSASTDNAVLSGVISTPNPCYTFDSDIEADGTDLTLTVTARRQSGMCIQVLGLFSYEARITGLVSGNYVTRMVYRYPETGWETKEYLVQLRIP